VGEKRKRNEILQFGFLDSDLGILDETDSGLGQHSKNDFEDASQ
jgi:Fe-S cluster assembly ATPase SufC